MAGYRITQKEIEYLELNWKRILKETEPLSVQLVKFKDSFILARSLYGKTKHEKEYAKNYAREHRKKHKKNAKV